MGFLKSTKGSVISDYFKLLEDTGTFKTGATVNVALYEDHLEITPVSKKGTGRVILSYSKITDVFHGQSGELIQKRKSVIGRALAGGIFFGGIGAVVGGLSGTGTKTVRDTALYLIISYTDAEGGERYLQFEDTRNYHGRKLAAKLKEFTRVQPCSSEIEL